MNTSRTAHAVKSLIDNYEIDFHTSHSTALRRWHPESNPLAGSLDRDEVRR